MENRSINVPREVAEQRAEKAITGGILEIAGQETNQATTGSEAVRDPREMTAEEWADKWESLTIKDRFIFGKVMSDPNNSLPFLRLLFPELAIDRIVLCELEKSIEPGVDVRGVRFDVYLRDDRRRAFTIEMQMRDEKNLGLRSRYYASLMDEDLLYRGEPYNEMVESYVVFICPFDQFGYGLHRYTFRNMCEEIPGLPLGDRTKRVFLCCGSSKEDDVDEGLKRFLDYVNNGTISGEYTRELDKAVAYAKKNPIWRKEYMRWDLEIENERYKAREQGLEEGRAAGLEEGRAVGLQEGRAAGLEEGHAVGLQEGRAEGRREGAARLASLIMKLTPGTDEYQTALRGSEEARRALYEKYGI